MWKILRTKAAIAGLGTFLLAMTTTVASAQTISQNISGFNLPGVQLPQGHDEVRAADGTTCRSAVSGSGAYLDVGIIGNPDTGSAAGISHYGRLVVPIGKKSKRLDCSRLYNLEVQRLELELRLMQMGLNRSVAPPSGTAVSGGDSDTTDGGAADAEGTIKQASLDDENSGSGDWDDDGWSTAGRTETSTQ